MEALKVQKENVGSNKLASASSEDQPHGVASTNEFNRKCRTDQANDNRWFRMITKIAGFILIPIRSRSTDDVSDWERIEHRSLRTSEGERSLKYLYERDLSSRRHF